MFDQRLPVVDGDDGEWGDILNQFILKEHYDTGVNNTANGGHKTITIRPGTSSVGNAPLKFSSGSLLITPEIGAVEFLDNRLYFTQTTGPVRKVFATFDDSSGATGDIYYRDSSGNFVGLPIGANGKFLSVSGGLPSWQTGGSGGGFVNDVIGVTVDGGGSVISTGSKGYKVIQEDCTITGWTIVGKESGNCVVDVKKCTYANFPATTSISGSEKPTLSSAQKNQDNSLSSWTTSLVAGDILEFVVDSVSTVTRVSLFVNISK